MGKKILKNKLNQQITLMSKNKNLIDMDQKSNTSTKVEFEDIQDQINKIETILITTVVGYQNISAHQLVDYFDGPAPSGDVTTLQDVLDNRWLLIHELIELSELKNMGLKISAELLTTHPNGVDIAHVTATEYELKFAKEGNDLDWVRMRIGGINAWLEDSTMPVDLILKCQDLMQEYSTLY